MLLILNGRICLSICNIIASGTPIVTVIAPPYRHCPSLPSLRGRNDRSNLSNRRTDCFSSYTHSNAWLRNDVKDRQIASAPTLFSTLGFAMTLKIDRLLQLLRSFLCLSFAMTVRIGFAITF